MCTKKPPEKTKIFELKFMNMCTEGCYQKPEMLDNLWNEAVSMNEQRQILDATDDEGDLPIHLCAEFGNPTVLAWVIEKWKSNGEPLDINKPNSDGYTPLFLCCLKGYSGAEAVSGKAPQTKIMRLASVKILIENGADINFQADFTGMTSLHWAAYADDAATVQYFLSLPQT